MWLDESRGGSRFLLTKTGVAMLCQSIIANHAAIFEAREVLTGVGEAFSPTAPVIGLIEERCSHQRPILVC